MGADFGDTDTRLLPADAKTAGSVAEHGHRITAAIACSVARVGGSVEQSTRLLLHPDHEGGLHARHIAMRPGQTRALAYINRVWAGAAQTVSTSTVLGSRGHAFEVLAAPRGPHRDHTVARRAGRYRAPGPATTPALRRDRGRSAAPRH